MFHGMLSISMFALFGTPFLGREEIVQGVVARLGCSHCSTSVMASLPSSRFVNMLSFSVIYEASKRIDM